MLGLSGLETHCQNKAIYWRETLNKSILEELISIKDTFPKTLSKGRIKKFRKMGEYSQKYKPDLKSEIKIWRTALSAGVSTLRNKSK